MRLATLLLGLALLPALGACAGFTPVYGEHGLTAREVAVSFDKPSNRLEQLIYQDLALRLGTAGGDVPTVHVSATAAARNLTSQTITTPVTQEQMTVTAIVAVTAPDGTVLFHGTRRASADFTQGAQAEANQQAATDASERAAHTLADTIRLEVLAALSR